MRASQSTDLNFSGEEDSRATCFKRIRMSADWAWGGSVGKGVFASSAQACLRGDLRGGNVTWVLAKGKTWENVTVFGSLVDEFVGMSEGEELEDEKLYCEETK